MNKPACIMLSEGTSQQIDWLKKHHGPSHTRSACIAAAIDLLYREVRKNLPSEPITNTPSTSSQKNNKKHKKGK
jgi:hypothetical protein